VERFIGLSSIGVYGDQPTLDPVREDSPRPATDIYSCSKIAMESVLFGYRQNFGLKATVLRMSSVFGPGRRTPCFIRGLLVAALEGRTATVSADAERRRQFLFVDDAVASVLAALDAPALPEFAYNVTGGTWLTEAEVLAAARRAVPALRGDAADIPPLGLDGRTGPLDMTLARRDLGYAPQTTIEAGIARYAAFLADP
jgi:nucleoside-diphosphate-sugar epimerase